MPKGSESDTGTSGRCLGQSPDTLLVPIGEHCPYGPMMTRWLFMGVSDGPRCHGWSEALAYRLARFLERYTSSEIRMALRKELGDG